MSRVDELRKTVQETVTPDDLIMALLSGIKTARITGDEGRIHMAIFNLKQRHKDNGLLGDFHFNPSEIDPSSDLLERILYRLTTSEILCGDRIYFYLPKEIKDYLRAESYEKFGQGDRAVIDLMSRELEDNIGVS